MKDAWVPVVGAAAVAIISLAAGVYLRPSKQVRQSASSSPSYEIGSRWNQVAAILIGAAIAIAASRFGHLDWYFAISSGALAYGIIRFPAYMRYRKQVKGDRNRPEISN